MKNIVVHSGFARVALLMTAAVALHSTACGQSVFIYNVEGSIQGFNATTGVSTGPALLTGLNSNTSGESLSASGADLYYLYDTAPTPNPGDITDYNVGEYDTGAGAVINATVISVPSTVLVNPASILVSGSNLYLAYQSVSGSSFGINVYNSTTGALISTLATWTSATGGTTGVSMAVSGSNLYVVTSTGINVYNATTANQTGSSSPLISSNTFRGIAVSGSNIYVTDSSIQGIGEYTTAGATVKSNLVSGQFNTVAGLALSGSNLYASDVGGTGAIREFDDTTGAAISDPLASGLGIPYSIAVTGVPEPVAMPFVAAGVLALLAVRRRSTRKVR